MPVVGLLSSFSSNERNTAALNQGLKELGFVDGQNVVIDYRYAEGHYDQLPGLAAASVERKIAVASARTEGDLDAAFAILVHRSADVLFVINDPYFSSIRGQIVALAAHYALPAAYFSRYFPAAGGQMSYGTDFAEAYQECANYIGRILKGEKAGRFTGRAVVQVRAGDKPQDRQNTWPDYPAKCARTRRRSNRIGLLAAIAHNR
jgi:ABC-type uncharacterized transport system substrate-binding protein